MTIYRLTESDATKAVEAALLFFQKETTLEQVKTFLSDPKNYMFISEHNNEMTGFAYGYELQRFDGRKNMMYMHQVEVLPAHRKKGIGKQLMEHFIKACNQNDCERLFLITNKSNLPAVTLYNSVGGKTHHDDDILYTFQP